MALSDEKTSIMRDAFRLLRDYDDFPKTTDEEQLKAYWGKFARDTLDMIGKYKNHDLAQRQAMAVFRHIEYEYKQWRDEHEGKETNGRTGTVDQYALNEWRIG